MQKKNLTIQDLQKEAAIFSKLESEHDEASIFGSTDGKAVGTYLEQKRFFRIKIFRLMK